MKTQTKVLRKIDAYDYKGFLGHTMKVFLYSLRVNRGQVKEHSERVGLVAEEAAKRLKKDSKTAFAAGVLHDYAKILLPPALFDGHDISSEEYAEVKKHAIMGYKALKDIHLFVALCAGLHHALYDRGYGLTLNDFPKRLGIKTVKKAMEISVIISICDFVDAYSFRKSAIKDGSDANTSDLGSMLLDKYPDDHAVVETVLAVNREMFGCARKNK